MPAKCCNHKVHPGWHDYTGEHVMGGQTMVFTQLVQRGINVKAVAAKVPNAGHVCIASIDWTRWGIAATVAQVWAGKDWQVMQLVCNSEHDVSTKGSVSEAQEWKGYDDGPMHAQEEKSLGAATKRCDRTCGAGGSNAGWLHRQSALNKPCTTGNLHG